MKTTKFIVAIIIAFGFVGSASAQLVGSSSNVTNIATSTATTSTPVIITTSKPLGNGDPLAVTQAWGLTGYQTPKTAPGTIVTDEGGIQDTCPAWYGWGGCFDLTRTDYYRNQMRELGRQLRAQGVRGGIFTYWINL